MSKLQIMYAELREQGLSHPEALRQLARRLDVDTSTVHRALKYAERDNGPAWGEAA